MADDLVDNYDLMGKTKKQIIELLGKPDSEDSSLGFHYDLGPCRRGIDFGSLYLKFEHGRVRHIDKHCS